MEIYLLVALLFLYVVTAMLIKENLLQKIWTSAFICAGFLMFAALFFLRIRRQDVMLTADDFNWYFFVYVFGSLAFVLGLINLWIYRRALWHMWHTEVDTTTPKE